MKKSLFSMSTAALLASASITAWAAPVSIPNNFTSGSTAVAADVNANFTAIETSVNLSDGEITTNAGAISAETIRAMAAEGVNATAISDEATRAMAAEGANATAISDEATRAMAAEGANATAIAANTTAIGNIGNCPADMVAVGLLCVDTYEASVWDAATGGSQILSANIATACLPDGSDCGAGAANPIYARSVVSVNPAEQITWYQAVQACANVGKRLPTTAEWQMAASGTPSGDNGANDPTDTCNVGPAGTAVAATGASSAGTIPCVSSAGAFDMVGNLWEMTAEIDLPSGAGFTFINLNTDVGSVTRGFGASFNSGTSNIQTAITRGTGGPIFQNNEIGFRCVQ